MEELENKRLIQVVYRLECGDHPKLITSTERTINEEYIYVKIEAALCSHRRVRRER